MNKESTGNNIPSKNKDESEPKKKEYTWLDWLFISAGIVAIILSFFVVAVPDPNYPLNPLCEHEVRCYRWLDSCTWEYKEEQLGEQPNGKCLEWKNEGR